MDEFEEFEILERVRLSKERAAALNWRKVQELRRSHVFTPLDWQQMNNTNTYVTKPVEGSGEKRTIFKRADTCELLYRNSSLDDGQFRAVQKIRWVYQSLQRGLAPGASQIDGTKVDGRTTYADPIARMGYRAAEEYDIYYKPWATLCSDKTHKGGHGPFTHFGVVLDVVIENKSLTMVDLYRSTRKGTAKRILSEALSLYAKRRNPAEAQKINQRQMAKRAVG